MTLVPGDEVTKPLFVIIEFRKNKGEVTWV
jgi:hypothetical protein